MNLPAEWMDCLEAIGLVSLEVFIIAGVAFGLERSTKAVRWHRAIWQGAVMAMLMVTIFELTGIGRAAVCWGRSVTGWSPVLVQPMNPAMSNRAGEDIGRITPRFRQRVLKQLALHRVSPDDPEEPFLQGRAMPWPELVWLFGTCAVLAPMLLARLLFLGLRHRSNAAIGLGLDERVQRVQKRLGWVKGVRVFESDWLRSPVACGIIRPAVGLPANFTSQYSVTQQEVMLAHELAHLAGRDPAWQLVSDLMVSLVWWHPLGWWARYRLRSTAELVADDASSVIPGGTELLAECLVQLAAGLAPGRPAGWLGITGGGFRSVLGRRVERLVNEPGGAWSPLTGVRLAMLRTITPLALVIAAIAATAWAGPQKTGEPMKNIQQTWKRSFATLALFATLGTEAGHSVESTAPSAPPASANTADASPSPKVADAPIPAEGSGAIGSLNARTLVEDGRMLLEMGKLDEAEAKLEQAKRRAPSDAKASYYLGLVNSARKARGMNQPSADGAEPESVAIDRYRMDPRLAARYGLLPKAVASAPTTNLTRAEDAAPAIAPEEEPAPAPQYRMDPRLMRRYGLMPPASASQPNAAPAKRKPSSYGRQEVENKLNQIVFSAVSYDNIPLGDVLKDLQEQARKLDPAKQGLNFLMSNVSASAGRSPGIDPTTGVPLPAAAVDLGQVSIRLHLQDVRLKDVLDAMTRVADQPVKYSVEDYGVVFSPGEGPAIASSSAAGKPAQEAPRLQVRTFRVDTNTFWAGLEGAFGIPIHHSDETPSWNLAAKQAELRLAKAEDDLARVSKLHDSGAASQDELSKAQYEVKSAQLDVEAARGKERGKLEGAHNIQQALRQLLQQLGVNMDVPNKAVFYNELTGIVMVRATPDDLELVEAAIETLGGKALRVSGASDSANTRPAGTASMSVVGKVNREGTVDLPADQKIDLIEAIARAGGFAPSANKNKIELTRNGQTARYRFEDLKKMTDAAERVWVEPGDLVFVHESFF